MTTETKQVYSFKDKLYTSVENEFFIALEPLQPIKTSGTFHWKGSKLPWSLWLEIGAFLLWTYETHKAEGVVTLFYNHDKKEWAAWAFPQEGVGMTVEHLDKDPRFTEQRKAFGTGWVQFGSVHHHNDIGAFQSSTDDKDETNREGIHFTLGKLGHEALDIHARAVLGDFQHDVAQFTDWIELPENCGLPAKANKWIPVTMLREFRNEVFKYSGLDPRVYKEVEFPPIWKENYTHGKHVVSYGHQGGFYQHHQQGTIPCWAKQRTHEYGDQLEFGQVAAVAQAKSKKKEQASSEVSPPATSDGETFFTLRRKIGQVIQQVATANEVYVADLVDNWDERGIPDNFYCFTGEEMLIQSALEVLETNLDQYIEGYSADDCMEVYRTF